MDRWTLGFARSSNGIWLGVIRVRSWLITSGRPLPCTRKVSLTNSRNPFAIGCEPRFGTNGGNERDPQRQLQKPLPSRDPPDELRVPGWRTAHGSGNRRSLPKWPAILIRMSMAEPARFSRAQSDGYLEDLPNGNRRVRRPVNSGAELAARCS